MPREPEVEGQQDPAAPPGPPPGPEPWPPRDSSPEQVNRLVQQEMSHLKALKRLSIGSTFASPGDPDLPDFDPEAEFDMDASGDAGAFVRKASIHKQPSIRRERSVPTTRRERRKHAQPFRVDVDVDVAAGAAPPGAAKPDVAPGLDNIWVPAGVHPELAPNEWRTFVNDKLAEIRNSQEQQQLSRGPRHQSRLSHEVADLEEYVDASAILDKRRRSASSGEKRRSILDLSREFAADAHDEQLPPHTPDSPDAHDIADAFQPPDLRPLGGATSLRRSTHRMRRPARRGSLNKSPTDSSLPSTPRAASVSAPDLLHSSSQSAAPAPTDSPSSHSHSHSPSSSSSPSAAAASATASASASPMHFSPSAFASASASTSASSAASSSPSRQRSRSRLLGRPPLSVSISAAKAVATTAEQPPSPSAATPSPTASTMLRYRRRKLESETQHGHSRFKTPSPDSPQEVPERDPSRPPLSHVIQGSGSTNRSPTHSSSPSPSESDSNSEAEVSAHPPSADRYDIVDPAGSMDIRSSSTEAPLRHAKADPSSGDAALSKPENQDVPQGGSTFGGSGSSIMGSTFGGSILGAGATGHHESMGDTDDASARHDKPASQDESTPSDEKSKSRPDKVERRWRWLDANSSQKEADSGKESKPGRQKEGLTLAGLFKKRDAKRDAKKERERDQEREREKEREHEQQQQQQQELQHQQQQQLREEQRLRDHERERDQEHAHVPLTPISAVPGDEKTAGDASFSAAAAASASASASHAYSHSSAKHTSKTKATTKSRSQPNPDSQSASSQPTHLSSLSAGDAPRRPRGHMRADSRTSNRLAKEGGGSGSSTTPQTVKARGTRKTTAAIERNGHAPAYAGQPQSQSQSDMPSSMAQPEIKLPYDIPAHQISDRSYVMMYHRFPLHIERAIYRLSHMKLANPRRPLRQQVLLSNFMYAYLNLINYGYQQQQLQEFYSQQQGLQAETGFGGHLEAEQLEQLKRIETKNYDEAMYNAPDHGDVDSSSSSEDEAEMAVDVADEADEATYLFKTA